MAATPRILCVIETIGRGGGAEQLLATLLPALLAAGAQIEVAALFDWTEDLTTELQEHGIVVHRLSIPGRRALGRGLWRLRQLVRGRRYDIFWGHLLLGNLYARVAQLLVPRTKLVITLHSKDFGAEASSVGRILERGLLRRADRKVAVSDALRADYQKLFGWNDVEVIHNGVDVAAIRKLAAATDVASVRAHLGVADTDFLIVTPARFVPLKGHGYLLTAVRDLVHQGLPVHLVMAGEGPIEDSIRAQVTELAIGARVRLTGLLTHEQLIPLMASADAVVLPSLYESFGLVPLEAMAANAPVIATKVDGFLEVMRDNPNATLVEPASSEALAQAIRSLIASRDGRRESSIVESFDIKDCAAKWLSLFNNLAER